MKILTEDQVRIHQCVHEINEWFDGDKKTFGLSHYYSGSQHTEQAFQIPSSYKAKSGVALFSNANIKYHYCSTDGRSLDSINLEFDISKCFDDDVEIIKSKIVQLITSFPYHVSFVDTPST